MAKKVGEELGKRQVLFATLSRDEGKIEGSLKTGKMRQPAGWQCCASLMLRGWSNHNDTNFGAVRLLVAMPDTTLSDVSSHIDQAL